MLMVVMEDVHKPWKHPPVNNPSSGEAGEWQEVSGRSIFVPDAEMDANSIGVEELSRWEHPNPAYRSTESEADENPNEEVIKPHEKDGNGYGNLDSAFVNGRGENDTPINSETYIGSPSNQNRKVIMNKIKNTKIGDDIHYFSNGKEGRGIVIKMGSEYLEIFNDKGSVENIHINDTFFVKDIIINKTWDDMDANERYDALVKIHAPTPRFLSKSWNQLPKEIKGLLTKTGFTYETGNSKDSETEDHSRTGSQGNTQYSDDVKDKAGEVDPVIPFESVGTQTRDDDRSHIGHGIGQQSRFAKSDVEHGAYGSVGGNRAGVSTDTPVDASEDYEGETHDDKSEEFKLEDTKQTTKEAEYDAATGQRKGLGVGLGVGKEDSAGFNAIYGQGGGKPGVDQKYSGRKSGMTGVPDSNVGSFGLKYNSKKEQEEEDKE